MDAALIDQINANMRGFLDLDNVKDFFSQLKSQIQDNITQMAIITIEKNLDSLKLKYRTIEDVPESIEDILKEIAINITEKWFKAYVNELLYNITDGFNEYWENSVKYYLESFLEMSTTDSLSKFSLLYKARKLQQRVKGNPGIFNQKKEKLLDLLDSLPNNELKQFISSFDYFLRFLEEKELEGFDKRIKKAKDELKQAKEFEELSQMLEAFLNTIKRRSEKQKPRIWAQKTLLECYEEWGIEETAELLKIRFFNKAYIYAVVLGDKNAIVRLKQRHQQVDLSQFPEIGVTINMKDLNKLNIGLQELDNELKVMYSQKTRPIKFLSLFLDFFSSPEKIRESIQEDDVIIRQITRTVKIRESNYQLHELRPGTTEFENYQIKKKTEIEFEFWRMKAFAYYNDIENLDLEDWLEAIRELFGRYKPSTWELLEQSLEEHFKGNWITSIYLLAPVLERMIFEVLEENGYNIIAIKLDTKIFRKTLNILDETHNDNEEVSEILTPEFLLLLRVAIKDPDFLNIRNLVAHGMLEPAECTKEMSFTLLWLILMLSWRKKQLIEEKRITSAMYI